MSPKIDLFDDRAAIARRLSLGLGTENLLWPGLVVIRHAGDVVDPLALAVLVPLDVAIGRGASGPTAGCLPVTFSPGKTTRKRSSDPFVAPALVLVFSKSANDSDEIKKELSLASRYRIPVMTLRIEDVEPSDAFAYELATRQWIDAFDGWNARSILSSVG